MRLLRRIFGPYGHARVWKESAHLLLDLAVGIALFTIVVTMLSVSAGLLVTLVGLPLLALTIAIGRWMGTAERARARALLDTTLPGWPPLSAEGTWWQRATRLFRDGPGWKGLLYGVLMLPWGIVTFTVTVVIWSVAWSLAVYPFFGWALPGQEFGDGVHFTTLERVGIAIGGGIVGWLLVLALPYVIHGFAKASGALIRALLSPGNEAALAQRVTELRESRDATTDAAASELRRIERDLHDGAQQRLVSVAMNLGMAKDRLDSIEDEHARELVGRAHDEAKQAIVELRDLVRGIHPAVLTDRGLDAAVSALAARCPVPVTMHAELPRRLPPPVEAAAYFVVAEALTNVAKHSGAHSVTVRMVDRDDTLVVEIVDDGHGGADLGHGGGLQGLQDRIRGVEGRLRIASPPGGPTTLIAEVPCGS